MIDKVQENLREVPLDAEFAVYWRHGKDIYGIAGDRLDALFLGCPPEAHGTIKTVVIGKCQCRVTQRHCPLDQLFR